MHLLSDANFLTGGLFGALGICLSWIVKLITERTRLAVSRQDTAKERTRNDGLELTYFKERLEKMEAEIIDLRNRSEKCQTDRDSIARELERLEREAEELREQNKSQESQIKALEDKVRVLEVKPMRHTTSGILVDRESEV